MKDRMISNRAMTIAKKGVLWVIVFAFAVGTVYLIGVAYDWDWTGFGQYMSDGKSIAPKKLWDWMQLLVVPASLAIAALVFTYFQQKKEQTLNLDKGRQEVLRDYMDQMTNLVLKQRLRRSIPHRRVAALANSRTMAALRELDGNRKGLVVKFLIDLGPTTTESEEQNPSLEFTVFSNMDLRDAKLRHLNLDRVKFHDTELLNADFAYAKMKGMMITGRSTLDQKWQNAFNIVNNRRLVKCKWKDFSRVDFCGVRLSSCDFRGANLRGAKLDGCSLLGTKMNILTRVDKKWRIVWKLRNSKFKRISFTKQDLSGANLWLIDMPAAHFAKCKLSNAVLDGARMGGADFSQADLSGSHFIQASLRNVRTVNAYAAWADFSGADLKGADLRDAYFLGAVFGNARLENAKCEGASFCLADLRGCDFTSATFSDHTRFEGAKYDADTKWPTDFTPDGKDLKFMDNTESDGVRTDTLPSPGPSSNDDSTK